MPGCLCLALVRLRGSCIHQRAPDPLPGFPRLILWAWERPESLTFIVPRSTGVAYLAGTLSVGDNKFTWRSRMQPLFLPPANAAQLDASTTNAFRAERMKIARNVTEFFAFAPRIQHDQDDRPMPAFDADAAIIVNHQPPESLWLRAIQDQALPTKLRVELAQAGWVRAVL
jgi:hypothetical protein